MKSRTKTKVAEKKPWTFLVYMAGDNNLEADGVKDLAEMKKVGTRDGVNVVAQFDRPKGATRYLLQRNTRLELDVVKKLGKQDTGDPAALFDFVHWGVTTYSADRYALVLWNHGQGWDDTDIYADERVRDVRRPKRIWHSFFRTSVRKAAAIQRKGGFTARAILLDDGARDFLDNLEMKAVLEKIRKLLGRKLDLLGMDACLMSMVEVGYQARESVATTVGSEETEPLAGWPYDKVLAALARQPGMTGEDLGKVVVTEYMRSYEKSGEQVTQSVCDLTLASKVAAAVKCLATALTAALPVGYARYAINDARDKAQQYEVRDYVDLVDLCRLLCGLKDVPGPAKQAASDVVSVVCPQGGAGYVVQSGWSGQSLKNSNGAAIYFPTHDISPLYAGLDWGRDTGWGDFLAALLAAGRRA